MTEIAELRATAAAAAVDFLEAVARTGEHPVTAIASLMAEIQAKAGGTPSAA